MAKLTKTGKKIGRPSFAEIEARPKTNWLELFLTFIGFLTIDSKELSEPGPLNLYGSQMRFLAEVIDGLEHDVHNFVILKARQIGISTVSLAIDLFWIIAHPGTQGAIVTDTEGNRDKFRILLTRYISSLPRQYSIKVKAHNRSNLVLENGSSLDYIVAGTRKTATKVGVSRAYNFIHATEISSYGAIEGIQSLFATLAQKNPNRMYIFESTARGFNLFWTIWNQAKSDPMTQKAVFIGWWSNDLYQFDLEDPPQRKLFDKFWDGDVTVDEQERVNKCWETYGVRITPQQIAWYRWMEETQTGSTGLMLQDYPWCVHGGTRVGTQRGIIPIREIVPGDVTHWGRVSSCGPTGRSVLYKVRTSLGYELLCTKNHPLIGIDDNEYLAGDSKDVTVRLQAPNSADDIFCLEWTDGPVKSSINITEDFALLMGFFMGDGSMSYSRRSGAILSIACTGKDTDVVDECLRLIYSIFGVKAQTRNPSKGCVEVRVTSKFIYDVFKRIGLLRTDIGKTMRKVHVPDFIWRSPLRVTRQFLRGLFEADGFNAYGTPRVSFFSKYPDFVADVQLLLLSHGITSRQAHLNKTNGAGKIYLGNELQLRKNEAIAFNQRIGFVSKRKRENFSVNVKKRRGGQFEIPMVMQDTVISVEEDRVEDVYNLSVESSRRWFDANGLLTHNTEDDAFLQTGQTFFPVKRMQVLLRQLTDNPPPFKGYRYDFGVRFMDTTLVRVDNAEDSELKIYEEPSEIGQYVMGVDPAYGRSEYKDRNVVSVLRCYADKLVQVAEFASSTPEAYQCAWVMAHLAGCYKNIMMICEISGPGEATVLEIKHLRELFDAGMMPQPQNGGIEDLFGNARWFMYHRSDSPGAGYMLNWKTSLDNKLSILNQLRDSIQLEMVEVRSIQCALELQSMVQDGSVIEPAISSSKDDRVFGLAFAHRAWTDWVRGAQISNNETFDRESKREASLADGSSTTIVSHIISDFFAGKQREREEQAIEDQWE